MSNMELIHAAFSFNGQFFFFKFINKRFKYQYISVDDTILKIKKKTTLFEGNTLSSQSCLKAQTAKGLLLQLLREELIP